MEAFKLLLLTDVDSVEDIFRGLVGEVEVDRCLRAVDLYWVDTADEPAVDANSLQNAPVYRIVIILQGSVETLIWRGGWKIYSIIS